MPTPNATDDGADTRAAAGCRQVDHTADLALEMWAPSEPELLRQGARAIIALLTEDRPVQRTNTRAVSIAGLDPEDRLVQWLNEVIVAATADGFLFADADIELEGTGLTATMFGEAGRADAVVTELKSATYHDLSLSTDGDAWRAQVVIDV